MRLEDVEKRFQYLEELVFSCIKKPPLCKTCGDKPKHFEDRVEIKEKGECQYCNWGIKEKLSTRKRKLK